MADKAKAAEAKAKGNTEFQAPTARGAGGMKGEFALMVHKSGKLTS